MTAKFLTPHEIKYLAKCTLQTAKNHVEKRYKKQGEGFGTALFNACMKDWGSGPTTTAARLNSDASDHIENAWQFHDQIAGVLLQRSDRGYLPLLLQNSSLADKLAMSGSMWVDFKTVVKELKHD